MKINFKGLTFFDIANVFTKLIYIIILLAAMTCSVVIIYYGLLELYHSIKTLFNHTEEQEKGLLVNLLHSFEYLFIAPLPPLIIFSFKKYIWYIFPSKIGDEKSTVPENKKSGLTSDLAEKTYVSSIIGVTSTFILSFGIKAVGTSPKLEDFYVFGGLMLFLVIQIIFYNIISKHIH